MKRICAGTALGLAVVSFAACGGSDNDPDTPFGATAIIAVVNPVENEGNTADVPAVAGTDYAGIVIDADPGGGDTTDDTGLAVIGDVDVGDVSLIVDDGPSAPLSIIASGDVHDVAIAYNGDAAEIYPGFPIRYGVGGEIVEIAADDNATMALNQDNTIVFFDGGVHVGDLVIEGENVILFGEGFTERSVVVDGNVTVRGGSVRLRGVTITGDLTVFGNNFGMSFSVVEGTTQLNGQAISFLRNVFCQGANVPSSNAALYGNAGLAPIPLPDTGVCP